MSIFVSRRRQQQMHHKMMNLLEVVLYTERIVFERKSKEWEAKNKDPKIFWRRQEDKWKWNDVSHPHLLLWLSFFVVSDEEQVICFVRIFFHSLLLPWNPLQLQSETIPWDFSWKKNGLHHELDSRSSIEFYFRTIFKHFSLLSSSIHCPHPWFWVFPCISCSLVFFYSDDDSLL